MYKCKQSLNSPVFRNIFTHKTKTKYALRNENSFQEPLCFKNLYFQSVLHFAPWTQTLEQNNNIKKINL